MANILRFAPSNTSSTGSGLHVGGYRTLLYNYVLARQNPNSIFFVRCENTDESRSNEQCLKSIIEDMDWMGIKPDAGFKLENGNLVQFDNTGKNLGPFYQTERKSIHDKYIDILLKEDKAYERDGAVYFRMPKEDMAEYDLILGIVTLPKSQCEDFVIRKSAGIASFVFANYIDDMTQAEAAGMDMIVLRGQEHLPGLFKQTAIRMALGKPKIKYGSLGIVMNPDKTKMSKRNAEFAVNIQDFRQAGYLPSVLNNFLSLLGWNPSGDKEEFDMEFLIKNFSLDRVNKGNPIFDKKKLDRFNGNAIAKMSDDDFYNEVIRYGEKYHRDKVNGWFGFAGGYIPGIQKITNLFHSRSKTLKDPFDSSDWLIKDQLEYTDAGKIHAEHMGTLHYVLEGLEGLEDWSSAGIMGIFENIKNTHNLSMNKIAMPIRAVLTGGNISPPIDQVILTLGRDRTLKRLNDFMPKPIGV